MLRIGRLRFYFFSREEARPHIHVEAPEGEVKIWLEPEITVAENHGLRERDLRTALRTVREHDDEIRRAWNAHFGG